MRRWMKQWITVLVIVTLMVGVVGCSNNTTSGNDVVTTTPKKDNIVTIGVTDTLGSIHPLLEDGTEVVKYAISLSFLSLLDINKDLEFEGQIAKEITTTDNRHFTITLDENAKWSDGTPITSKDVLFSFLCKASPEVGNAGMSMYEIEGVGEDGYVEEGATEIPGIVAKDDRTVEITTKAEMALSAFQNVFGRYIHILPEHILKEVPKKELLTYDWFNKPTVVSGPYILDSYDLNHYVTYKSNSNYFKGAPKIPTLQIKVVTANQLLTGLQAGEIDIVQQTMGSILPEDYEAVKALQNVSLYDGTPITTQSIFFNTEKVENVKVRQAFAYGVDRQAILTGTMNGKGEIVDGFLASAGPYYDSDLSVGSYDPEKAKALLKEAEAEGWNPATEYKFYVNSGDTTFVQAASYIAATLGEIGLNIQVVTVDLATLLSTAGSGEFDILAVQYTYAPVDPYTDMVWLLSKDGWTKYENSIVAEALAKTQTALSIEEGRAQYLVANQQVQHDVPMLSTYVISALGVVNKRLVNVTPDVYGTFLNVQEWEIK